MVSMLGRCDAVLAVSRFVRDKFASMGVEPGVLRVMAIGSRVNEIVAGRGGKPLEPPPFDPPRPVRVVFMGYNNWYKGLPMLADVLDSLSPEVLGRLDLSLYALGVESIEWRFRRIEPLLGGLTVRNGYAPQDIPWLLAAKDLGLVPSVWWDNAPQTVFEFFACGLPVLAAEVGGIPDFVRDGYNGLLFRGNDRAALAEALTRVVNDPDQLWRLRRNVEPPKDMAEHVSELETLYAGLRSGESVGV
jgi:glycosyltransferase involved in cell wall biosynthesis